MSDCIILPVATGKPSITGALKSGHGVRRTRDRRLREIEKNRFIVAISQAEADLLGVRRDGEGIAELVAHVGGNAGLPQADLAIAIDEAEGGIGRGDRNRVTARLQVRIVSSLSGKGSPSRLPSRSKVTSGLFQRS